MTSDALILILKKEFLLSASMIEAGKKTAPSSKADHYFHIDYIPFPDSDPYRIDCITYGLGAKVTHMCGTNYLYDEIVQVHTYQDVSWVVLNRVHFLDTSADEKLESIFAHKIDIRLCDDKGLNQIYHSFQFRPDLFYFAKNNLDFSKLPSIVLTENLISF